MKALWEEAYERACDQVEGEPSDAMVAAIFQDLVERHYEQQEAA